MKTAVYYSNDDIRIEERARPGISDKEILVEMRASGICGTDVMQWYRRKKAPRVLGHEMAGVVAAIGSGAEGFKKGDRVFVSHHVPCYNCRYCINGDLTACGFLHSGNYDPGGFSEFIRIPEQNVRHGTLLLPDHVSFEDATMIEPLGCVVAGQKKAGIGKGRTALVIGSGVSGLLHIQMAKLKGAHVIAVDLNDYRMKKASEAGADHVIHADVYSIEKLKELNSGRLADVVVVCAASEKAVMDAVSSVDRAGIILFFAVPETDLALPLERFWRDEVTVRFSYGAAPEDLKEALGLIQGRSVDAGKMITHKLALSDIQTGFGLVAGAGNSLKVVLMPDADMS